AYWLHSRQQNSGGAAGLQIAQRGLPCGLAQFEDVVVPRWPLASTITGTPVGTVARLIPAINGFVSSFGRVKGILAMAKFLGNPADCQADQVTRLLRLCLRDRPRIQPRQLVSRA